MRLIEHVKKTRKNREADGSSFIEVAIASFFLAIIVFFGLDAYVWMQAFMLNDLACRDACRAAAQATHTTNTPGAYAGAAQQAAIRELQLHSVPRPYIGNPTFVAAGFQWNDFGASNGGPMPGLPQTPFVRVQSSMSVNLPVPLGPSGAMVFQRSYSMPIVNLPPPS